MNRNILKRGLVIGLFILSIFIVFIPNASAGFIDVYPIITVTHERAERNVIPNSGVLDINISTTFTLTGTWANFVRNSIFSLLKYSTIPITLEVSPYYDYISPSITNSYPRLKVGEPGSSWISTIHVTVTEKAPAFTLGKVKVTATSSRLYGLLCNIAEKTEVFEVPFEIGYFPLISTELPEGNYFKTSPYGQISIPINITNLGNGVTYVDIDVIDSPEDWTYSIPSSITLEPFDGEGQINLNVHPEGHIFEIETINVSLTPQYLGCSDLKGDPTILTFVIELGGGYSI